MHQPSEFCEPLDSFTAAFFGRSEGKLLKVDIEEVSFSGTKNLTTSVRHIQHHIGWITLPHQHGNGCRTPKLISRNPHRRFVP
jgi:hypothetical protein